MSNSILFNPKCKIIKIIAAIVCMCFLWQDVVLASRGDFIRQVQWSQQTSPNPATAPATGEKEWLDEFDKGMDLSKSSWGAIPKAFRRALVVKRLLHRLNSALHVERKPHQLTVTNFTEIEIRQTADKVKTLGSLYGYYSKEFPGDEGQVLTKMLHDLSGPEAEDGVLLPEGQERVLIWHREERERAKRKIAQFITNCAVYEPDFENNGFFKETKRQKPLSGGELKNFLLENDILRHENWTRPIFSRAVFRDWYFSTTGIVDTVAGGPDQFYDLIEEAVPGIITAEEIRRSKSRVKVNSQLRLFYRYTNYIEKEVIEALEKKKTESEMRSAEFLEKTARARTRQDELFNKASDAEQAAKELAADILRYKMDFNRLKEYGLQAICDEPTPVELTHNEELLSVLEGWSGVIEKWIKRLFGGNNPDEKFIEIFEAVSIGLFTRDDLDTFEEKQIFDDICEVFGGSNNTPYAGHQVDPDKAIELAKKIKLTALNRWSKEVDSLKEILFEQLKQLGISGKATLVNLKKTIRKSRAFESARYIADDCLQQEKLSVLDLDGRFGLFYSALSDAEKTNIDTTTVSDQVSSKLKIAYPAKQMPNRMLVGADEAEGILTSDSEKDKFGLVTSIFGMHPDDAMAVQRLVYVSQNALKTGGRLAIALPHTLGFYTDAIDKMQECGFRLEHQVLVREQLGDLEAIELLVDRPEELQRRKGQSPRFIMAVFTKTEDISILRTDLAVSKIDWRDAEVPADVTEERALPFALVRAGKDMPKQPVVIRPATDSERIPYIKYRGEHERLAHLLRLIVKYQKYILQGPESASSTYAASYMTLNRLLQNVFDIEVKKDTIVVKLRVGEDDVSELSYRIRWVLLSSALRDVTVQLGVLFNRLTETYAAANANGSFSVFKEYPDFERWMEIIYTHRENEFLFSQDEREFIERFANDCWLDAKRPPTKEEAGTVRQLFVMNVQRYTRHKHRLFWLATARKKPQQLAAYLNTGNPLYAYTSLITYFSAHRVMEIIKSHFAQSRPDEQLSNIKAIILDIGAGTGTGSVSMYNAGFNLDPDSDVRMIEVDNNLGLLNVARVVKSQAADIEIPTTKVLGNAQELSDALNGNDITGNPVNIKEGGADAITSLFLVHLFKSSTDRMNFFLQARKWLKPNGVFVLTYPAGIQFNKEMAQELNKMGYGVSVPELYSQKVKDEVEEKITKWVARKYPEVYHNRELRQRVVARVKSFAEKRFTMLMLWKEKDVPDEGLKGINPDNFAMPKKSAEETMQAPRRPAAVLKPEGGLPFDPIAFPANTIAEEWLLTEAHPQRDLEENQEKLLSRKELLEMYPEFETTLAYLHNYRELFDLAERIQIDNVFESWHTGTQLISEAAVSMMQAYYHRPLVLGSIAAIQQDVSSLTSSIRRDFPIAALCIAASLPEEERRSFLHTANRLRGQAHLGDTNTLSLAELASLERWSMPLAGLYGFYEGQFAEIYRNSSSENVQAVLNRMNKTGLEGLFKEKARRSAMIGALAGLHGLTPEAVCYNFDPYKQPQAATEQINQAAFACAKAFVEALYKNCPTRTKQGIVIEGWAQASINEICSLFPDIENPLIAPVKTEKADESTAETVFSGWPKFAVLDLAAIMQKKMANGENLDAIPYSKEVVEHPVLGILPIEEIAEACDHISLRWAAIFPQLEPPATWQLDDGERGVIKNLFAHLSRSETADNTIRIYGLLNNFLSARNSANRRFYARPQFVAIGQSHDVLEFRDSAERIKMSRLETKHIQLLNDMLQVELNLDKSAATDSATAIENAIKDLTNYASLLDDPDSDNLIKIIICSNISTYIPRLADPRLLYEKIFSLPSSHPLRAYFSKDISLRRNASLKDGLREYFLKHPFRKPADISEIVKSDNEDKKTELVMALRDLFINENDPYVLFGAYLTFYDLLKYEHPERDEYLRRMFDYIEVCFTERFANLGADTGMSAFLHWQLALTADTLFGENTSTSKEFVARLYRSRTSGWTKILTEINEAKDSLDRLDAAGFEDLINSLELIKFTTAFPVSFSGQQDEFGAVIEPNTFINLNRLIDVLSFPQGKEAILYYFIKLHKQLLADIALKAVDRYKKENPALSLTQQLDYAAFVLQRLGFFNMIDERPLQAGSFDQSDVRFYEQLAMAMQHGTKEDLQQLVQDVDAVEKVKALEHSWQRFFPYESQDEWINNSRRWMKNWFTASPENQQKAALLFKEPIASEEETTVLKGLTELFLKAPNEDSWGRLNEYILDERSVPRAVAFMQLIHKRRAITEDPKILENIARLEEFSSALLEKLGFIVKGSLEKENLFHNMWARKGLADVYNDPGIEMADQIRVLGISAPHDQFLYEFMKVADEKTRKDYAGLMSMAQKAFEQEEQLLIKSLSANFGIVDEPTIKNVHDTFVPGKSVIEYIPLERHHEFDAKFASMLSNANPIIVHGARKALSVRLKNLSAEIEAGAGAAGEQRQALVEKIWQNVLTASGALKSSKTITLPTLDDQLEVMTPLVLACSDTSLHGEIIAKIFDASYTTKDSDNDLFFSRLDTHLIPLLNGLDRALIASGIEAPRTLTETVLAIVLPTNAPSKDSFEKRLKETIEQIKFCQQRMPKGCNLSVSFYLAWLNLLFFEEIDRKDPFFIAFIGWLKFNNFIGLTEKEIKTKLKTTPQSELPPWFLLKEDSFPDGFGEKFLQFQQAWDALLPDQPPVNWRRVWFDMVFEKACSGITDEPEPDVAFVKHAQRMRLLNDAITAQPAEKARQTVASLESQEPVFDKSDLYNIIQMHRDCHSMANKDDEYASNRHKAAMGIRALENMLAKHYLSLKYDTKDTKLSRDRDAISYLLHDLRYRTPWFSVDSVRLNNNFAIYKFFLILNMSLNTNKDDMSTLNSFVHNTTGPLTDIADFKERRNFLGLMAEVLAGCGVIQDDAVNIDIDFRENPQLRRGILCYNLAKYTLPLSDFEYIRKKLPEIRRKGSVKFSNATNIVNIINNSNAGVCLIIDQLYSGGVDIVAQIMKDHSLESDPAKNERVIRYIINIIRPQDEDFSSFMMFAANARLQHLLRQNKPERIGIPAPDYKTAGFKNQPALYTIFDLFIWAMTIRPDVREAIEALESSNDPIVALTAHDLMTAHAARAAGAEADAAATGEAANQTLIFVAYISSTILLGWLTLCLLRKAVRNISYLFPKNKHEAYGLSVRTLLEKIPEELDAWLDKPVNVALWVADHDETLCMTGKGGIKRDILNLITRSLIKTKALWIIFTGSAVYENPQTDIGRRTLQPIEDALLKHEELEPLSRLMVLGAIGQQIIGYDKKGRRTHIENKHARYFTPAQQLYIMKLWLNYFVQQYYNVHVKKYKKPQVSRDEFKTKIEKAESPEELETIASEIKRVLKLSRLEIVRRGVNPETRKFSPHFAGTLSFHLPLDGSLNAIGASFVDVFNSCIEPQIEGIKPIVEGGAYLTITFYSKDEQLRRIYPAISKKMPEDGIIAMLGDNPDADTFFLTNSADFGKPVLKFLLDNSKTKTYPGLLYPGRDYVEGAKDVIDMLDKAEKRRTTYRNLPVFSAQGRKFSIADVEWQTGQRWEDLRLAPTRANLVGISNTYDNASTNPDSNAGSSTDANMTGAQLRKEAAETVREALESATSDPRAYALIFGDYTREDVESLTDRKLYVAVFAPSLEKEFTDKKMEFANKVAAELEAKEYKLGEPIRSPDPLLGKVSFAKEEELLTYNHSKITDFGIQKRDQFCFIKITKDDIKYTGPALNEYHDEQYYYGYTAQIGTISKRFQDELAEALETDKFGLKTIIDEALVKYNVTIPEDAKTALLKLSAQYQLAEKYAEEYGDSAAAATITGMDQAMLEQLLKTGLIGFVKDYSRSNYDEPERLELKFMAGGNKVYINIINQLNFNITNLLNKIFINEAQRSQGSIKCIKCPFNSPLAEGIAILDTSVRNIVIVYEDGIADWKLDEVKERMHKLLFMAGAFIKTEGIGANRIYKQDDCPIWISVSKINELIKQQHTLSPDETNILLTLEMHKVYSSKGFDIYLPPIFKRSADSEKIETGGETWFQFTRSKAKNKNWRNVRKQITLDWKGGSLLPGLSQPILDIDTRKAIYNIQRAWSNIHRLKQEGRKLKELYEENTMYVEKNILDFMLTRGYITKNSEKENFYRLLWHPDSEYMPNLARIMAAEIADVTPGSVASMTGVVHKKFSDYGTSYETELSGVRFQLGVFSENSPYYGTAREGKFWMEDAGAELRLARQNGQPNNMETILTIPVIAIGKERFVAKRNGGRNVIYKQKGRDGNSVTFKLDTPRSQSHRQRLRLREYYPELDAIVNTDELKPTGETVVTAMPLYNEFGKIIGHKAVVHWSDRIWVFDPRINGPLWPYLSNQDGRQVVFRRFEDKKAQVIFIGPDKKTERACTILINGAEFKITDATAGKTNVQPVREYAVPDTFHNSIHIAKIIPNTGAWSNKGAKASRIRADHKSNLYVKKPLSRTRFLKIMRQYGWNIPKAARAEDGLSNYAKCRSFLKFVNTFGFTDILEHKLRSLYKKHKQINEVARILGVKRTTVNGWLRQFGIIDVRLAGQKKETNRARVLKPLSKEEFIAIMQRHGWNVNEAMSSRESPCLADYTNDRNFFSIVKRFGLSDVLIREIWRFLEENKYEYMEAAEILGIEMFTFRDWRNKLGIYDEVAEKKREFFAAKRQASEQANYEIAKERKKLFAAKKLAREQAERSKRRIEILKRPNLKGAIPIKEIKRAVSAVLAKRPAEESNDKPADIVVENILLEDATISADPEVKTLIGDIFSEDNGAYARQDTAKKLGRLALMQPLSTATYAIDRLAGYKDESVRRLAVTAYLSAKNNGALIGMLQDEEPLVREVTVVALGDLNDIGALSAIESALKQEKDYLVRQLLMHTKSSLTLKARPSLSREAIREAVRDVALETAFEGTEAGMAGQLGSAVEALEVAEAKMTGVEELKQISQWTDDLPGYSVPAAKLRCVLDLLLERERPSVELSGEALKEYNSLKNYLEQNYPDLRCGGASVVRFSEDQAGEGIVGFEIKTAQNRYLFAIQKSKFLHGNYDGLKINLENLRNENYRLMEIITKVLYPWQPPYHYPRSFLEGKTDRFGIPLETDKTEACELKPGSNEGAFQLFRLAPVHPEEESLSWEELTAEPQAGNDDLSFERRNDKQTHYFVKDYSSGMAADIVTGPAILNHGALLLVAFANGNAGLGLFDSAADSPYEIKDIRSIRRGGKSQKGVEFTVTSNSSRAFFDAGGIILDTTRHIREWSWTLNKEPRKRGRLEKFEEFRDAIAHLPQEIHAQLQEREGIYLGQVYKNTLPTPRVFHKRGEQSQRLYILRPNSEGRLYFVEMIFPAHYEISKRPDGIEIDSKGEMITYKITITTDFPALNGLSGEEIFTPEVQTFAAGHPAFKDKMEEVEFLAFGEFFAAGAHRFLQYFSRDTLVWLRLFSPLLSQKAHETTLQGVINRISPEGELPSVEEVYDQVAFELVEEFCAACNEARVSGDYERVLDIAATFKNMPSRRPKYGVPDANLMFLPAMLDYLNRQDISEEDKVNFLNRQNSHGVKNFNAFLRNMELVALNAEDYMRARSSHANWPEGLIGIKDEGYIANWRDVTYGLGSGKYPADVNAELMPLALEAASGICRFIEQLSLDDEQMRQIKTIKNRYGIDTGSQALLNLWNNVKSRIQLALTEDEIRSRLTRYLITGPVSTQERSWFLNQPLGEGVTLSDFLNAEQQRRPQLLQGGMKYFPVALYENGTPVPVVASDEIMGLFDDNIEPGKLMETIAPIFLPYPAGLWTPAGLLAASAALSNNERLWNQITKNAYGGSVIYGREMELLKQGLMRQLIRLEQFPPEKSDNRLLEVLYSGLVACCETIPASGHGHELWTWHIDERGAFSSVPFGSLLGHNDESNPVQLWSISQNEMLIDRIHQIAKKLGLRLLKEGEFLDAIAQLKKDYPVTAVNEIPQPPSLPRVALVSFSLPPGGGGVNTVVWDQLTMLKAAGYPVTVLGGQVLSGAEGEDKIRNMGADLTIMPELDLQKDIEGQAWGENLNHGDFRWRIDELKNKLRQSLENVDVILVHQITTMPGNPVATIAFSELAKEYYGQKRFVGWIHNIVSGKIESWPLSAITSLDAHIEYVAVSPQLRDSAFEIFKVDPGLINTVNNSVSARNFLNVSDNVLKFYFDHRLYDADSVWFYPSRMANTKLLEAAIWAVCEANYHQNMDVRLVIATPAINGQLPNQGAEGDYFRRLVELRDRLGLTDKVIFYAHHGPSSEIKDLYLLSDALVFTSQVETFGIPVLESMLSGTAIFRVGLPELDRLTAGIDHVVMPRLYETGKSLEQYGKYFGYLGVKYLRENPAYVNVKRGQKLALSKLSSEAVFFGALAPFLRIPAPKQRSIHAAGKNFSGERIEDSITNSINAGFSSFEINFEGFKPWDVAEDGRRNIHDIKQSADGEFNLDIRLTEFPNWDEKAPLEILKEAAGFALDTGVRTITVRVKELDEKTIEAILKADKWIKGEALRREQPIPDTFFSVENINAFGNVISTNDLNRAFENKPIGVSVWLDSIMDNQNPLGYIENLRVELKNLYAGKGMLEKGISEQEEKAGRILRFLRERDWTGEVVAHAPVGPLETRRMILDKVIGAAYLSSEALQSLRTGEISTPPNLDYTIAGPVTDETVTTGNMTGIDQPGAAVRALEVNDEEARRRMMAREAEKKKVLVLQRAVGLPADMFIMLRKLGFVVYFEDSLLLLPEDSLDSEIKSRVEKVKDDYDLVIGIKENGDYFVRFKGAIAEGAQSPAVEYKEIKHNELEETLKEWL